VMPNQAGRYTTVLDLGANVDCSAEHLLQFAVMGSALVAAVEGKPNPSVGLLNIGEEAIKGSETIKQAGELLRAAAAGGMLNFHGNVEGNDIFKGTTDVVVCDAQSNTIRWIRQGFSRMAKLVERDPENTTQSLELLNIQRRLVHSLSLVGQGQEALSLGLDLIVKERAVAAQAGPRQELRYDLPRAYTAMADACRALGKRDEARKWYRSAIGGWEAIISEGHYSPDAASGLEEAKMAEQKLRGPGE